VDDNTIIYTVCDEAPQLATYALLPVLRRVCEPYGVKLQTSDISVAGRILANIRPADNPDRLAELGQLSLTPQANIIKLPNISASVPQLGDAIAELQSQGYDIPNYPVTPANKEEEEIQAAYNKAVGSSVNPVLREGNSDRRCAPVVKKNCQNSRPPVRMREWEKHNTHVAHMSEGDFFASEQSHTMPAAGSVSIEFTPAGGATKVLKAAHPLQEGEVIDASFMSAKALRAFYEKEIAAAKDEGIMLSLHLKATMMKISDPIIFGHCVSVYYKDAIEKHADALAKVGANPNFGVADMLDRVSNLDDIHLQSEIVADFDATYETRPGLAMVDSNNGITNLHVPNDVIIDASMPPLIRDGGQMWNRDDALEPTKALIPDRCYAGIYKAIVEDCHEHGQFDHSTMGNVANVGLMAQKAEEYGSHDKTFEIEADGQVHVKCDTTGDVIFTHDVGQGDIWRMAQTKDAPIKDWVRLAVERARATGDQTVFWLNPDRAHDRSLMAKIESYMPEFSPEGLNISIQHPVEAMKTACTNARAGRNTITCTGNVLRDYLTDLFPILELGTSAKMLSIVPLLDGGGLFETGAGGSAPKHVDQFLKEGHLRWDSLGEYLAMAVSLEHLGARTNNAKATLLGETLNEAVGQLLDNDKSPGRKVHEIDNRGSHYYVGLYWSQALAKHDPETYGDLAKALADNEEQITKDLIDCQGTPMDNGGYFKPDDAKAEANMRPSATLNAIIDG
jgi:isocitrate dehydrogenase